MRCYPRTAPGHAPSTQLIRLRRAGKQSWQEFPWELKIKRRPMSGVWSFPLRMEDTRSGTRISTHLP